MEAYMEVRTLTQEFIDDFLGMYISPKNRLMNSLLIGPGLPGGMMGSLMADLETNLESINKYFAKNNKPLMSQDQLLIKLFDEVAHVWPKIGYPPLVTPFSQYVKNLALMNVMQMLRGKERWSMIADDIWDMILGKSGRVPGDVSPEIKALAQKEGREFFLGNPQENYPDQLDLYRGKMKEKGWDIGQDEEELFEYAMHPAQYEAYKSGKAKADFEADIAKRREELHKKTLGPQTKPVDFTPMPQQMMIHVNGEKFNVSVSYGDSGELRTSQPEKTVAPSGPVTGASQVILSPLEGKFFLTKNATETPLKVGDTVNVGDVMGYIEAMKTYNAVSSEVSGKIIEICIHNGETVEEDDVLFKLA